MKEKLAALASVAAVMAAPALLAWYAHVVRPAAYPREVHVLDLTGFAQQGLWTLDRVHNLNYWWKDFDPATLHFRLNEEVVLRLHSADVVHQFYVPALALGPVNVEPGHVSHLRFAADEEGVFQYYCTSLCGDCHFYMTGWIVVTPAGKTPVEPDPITCPLCVPEPEPPEDTDVVALGDYLYHRMACTACHGPEGRGGVSNYNYINGEIPSHMTMAAKIFLRSPEDAKTLLDWLGRGRITAAGDDTPEIAGFPIVRARLEAAIHLIQAGKNAAKADLEGPEPPLQMPSWQNKITAREADALMGYLVSLFPWDDEQG